MSGSVEVVKDGEGYAWKVPLPVEEMHRGRVLEARRNDVVLRRWKPSPGNSGWWSDGVFYTIGDIAGVCIDAGLDLYSLPVGAES